MNKEIREVIKRLDEDLRIASSDTVSSEYFRFLSDIRALVAYVKRRKQ